MMTRLPARGQRQVRGVIRDACFLMIGNTALEASVVSAILRDISPGLEPKISQCNVKD